MAESESSVVCSECGEPRDPDYDGQCRACGSKHRTVHPEGLLAGSSFDTVEVTVTTVREFVERHPGWTAVALGTAVGGVVITPLLGPV